MVEILSMNRKGSWIMSLPLSL